MSNKLSYSYAAIATTLAWDIAHMPGEDGLFLQPEEVTAIDSAISASITTEADLAASNKEVETLTAQLSDMTEAANVATQKIADLENELVQLKSAPSGNGTKLSTKEDVKPESAEVLTINHPDHPWNVEARREINARKSLKKNRS